MGKKKENRAIGRALIKDRFSGGRRKDKDSHLHTSELEDGYDWNKINFKSVTEENTLDEFLATAELAGTEFTAEKMNVKIVTAANNSGLLSSEEEAKVKRTQQKHKQLLKIPRRPHWDETTTASELDVKEREAFLDWRRQLAELQEVEGLVLTPFERNLDFWRQLWRVVERSEILVQIVDARNPLLFRCDDLEVYVKEVDSRKVSVILINKADYLSETQRSIWASYFGEKGIRVAFWSAVNEMERIKEQENQEAEEEDSEGEYTASDEDDNNDDDDKTDEDADVDDEDDECNWETDESDGNSEGDDDLKTKTDKNAVNKSNDYKMEELKISGDVRAKLLTSSTSTDDSQNKVINSPEILNGDDLLDMLKALYSGPTYTPDVITIGLVGYPNVGKSSTLNALIQTKKVPVSSTPGRTKHFQTLYVESGLMLCDCPGLVMPTFVTTKAHMVTNGILPIDQMRDYVPPVSLLCQQMGRDVLEKEYGIMLPHPQEGEDPDRPPTAHEFLGVYSCMRGFMTHKGVPDYQRSARQVLKDFVNGRLVYCQPPPAMSPSEFQSVRPTTKVSRKQATAAADTKQASKPQDNSSELDTAFFQKPQVRVGSKGVKGVTDFSRKDGFTSHHSQSAGSDAVHKPWKKHGNRGKKEKLRRIHGYMDS